MAINPSNALPIGDDYYNSEQYKAACRFGSYDQDAFKQRLEQIEAQRIAEDEKNPAIVAAGNALDKAQGKLEQEQHILKNLPLDSRWAHYTQAERANVRLQMVERVEQARQAVSDAEQGLRQAENTVVHTRYLKQLQEKKDAKQQARDREQASYAQKEEEAFRERAQAHFLAAGGTLEQFKQSYPLLWQQELIERTRQAAQEESHQHSSARNAF